MIDKKTFTIGMLSLTAVVLFVANLMMPQPADAYVAVKDRDYTAVTGRTTRGGEALFLTDNRTGTLAVFVFDPTARTLRALDVRSLTEAFSGRAPAAEANDRTNRNNAANRAKQAK
jgi:hypothetical protein